MTPQRHGAGRKSKLTPEVGRIITVHLAAGATMRESAHAAGVTPRTLRRWIARGGLERSGPFAEFRRAVINAHRKARPKSSPRHIRRAVGERQLADSQILSMVYAEIMRTLDEGRVPDDIAVQALDMALDDAREKIMDQEGRMSWARDPGDRN